MVLKKDAILTLIKSASGTMNAAGLALAEPKNPGEDDSDLVFTGEAGEVILKEEDNTIKILCKRGDDEPVCVSQTLFDYENEDWSAKDIKSVANEVSESVANFFGVAVVYESKAESKGKNETKKNVEITPEIEEFLAKGKKRSKKESTITYEPENLANRMENIFPDIKGELDKNAEKYDGFLPEEYFATFVTPRIIEAIREEDRPIIKKVFNAFNIFYDEGNNDMQSLIAVSILGIAFSEEDGLIEKCETLMSETLYAGIIPVVNYLKTSKGKNKVKELRNPKPIKSKQ